MEWKPRPSSPRPTFHRLREHLLGAGPMPGPRIDTPHGDPGLPAASTGHSLRPLSGPHLQDQRKRAEQGAEVVYDSDPDGLSPAAKKRENSWWVVLGGVWSRPPGVPKTPVRGSQSQTGLVTVLQTYLSSPPSGFRGVFRKRRDSGSVSQPNAKAGGESGRLLCSRPFRFAATENSATPPGLRKIQLL